VSPLIKLVYNELLKLSGRKRLLVIALIVSALVSIFTYAQYETAKEFQKRFGNVDWRKALELRIQGWENRIDSPRTSIEQQNELRIRIAQNQYYLDKDINPSTVGAPTFVRELIENATTLLIPLLVMIIAADIVSSEFSGGTIKVLLTRPVRRWRILMSKFITLMLTVSLVLLMFTCIALLISGAIFGFAGWDAPILTGFTLDGNQLDTTAVKMLPNWQFIVMELGLAWVVAITVATISMMLSVLVRSTAAGMGIMLAFLIAGLILSGLVESWEGAKYLFMVNLDLIDYLEDAEPPVPGMTLGFSLSVLAAWSVASLLISFRVFTKRDVF
jgi:ABC-2 type transport system permease protein